MQPEPAKARTRAGAIPLCAVALFVLFWEIARAAVSSITIDEANTWSAFVAPPYPAHWLAATNNHVLNSMLMRLSVALFGLGHLSVRAPALLGAAIYLCAALVLTAAVTTRTLTRLALFVCLAANPFLLDFLVAARGYSLAMAFLTAAVAIAAVPRLRPEMKYRPEFVSIAASLCLGLSFAANFAFGIVDVGAAAIICLWTLSDCPPRSSLWSRARIVAACSLPALAVALFFGAPALLHWHRDDLWFGTQSVLEMFRSVVRDSFYEPNGYLLNPYLAGFLDRWHHLIPLLLSAAVLWHVAATAVDGRSRRSDEWRRRGFVLVFLLAVLVVALGGHWALHLWWRVPLPLSRTALYSVPLATLAAGVAASLPGATRMAEASRRAAVAMLAVLACYFGCCLRLTYFKDWRFDADAKAAYFTAAYYSRTYGVTDVSANWRYVGVLEFYRHLYGAARLNEPRLEERYDLRRPLFILYYPDDQQFLKENGLKLVYQGGESGVVVAIRPGVETSPCACG